MCLIIMCTTALLSLLGTAKEVEEDPHLVKDLIVSWHKSWEEGYRNADIR